MTKKVVNLLIVCVCIALSACGSKNKVEDSLTNDWNETDTVNAVKFIVKQINESKTYQDYRKKLNGKVPKIFMDDVQNNTAEAYASIQDINDELLLELSNTNSFILIDDDGRDKILNEIKYQNDGMVDAKDAKKIGKQAGADIIILSNLNMKPEIKKGQEKKTYSLSIRMTDIETGIEIARARYVVSKIAKKSKYVW